MRAVVGPPSLEWVENNMQRHGLSGASAGVIDKWYNTYSVLKLIDAMPDDKKSAVRRHIDCGDDYFLFELNLHVHIAMRIKEIPHKFRIGDGGYSPTYWCESLPEVLEFVSDGFHQHCQVYRFIIYCYCPCEGQVKTEGSLPAIEKTRNREAP